MLILAHTATASSCGHLILKDNSQFVYSIFFLLQAQSAAADSKASIELSKRISCLEQEVAQYREDAGKAQSEVERLLEILRETENEKNDKEKKIHELERWETRMERCEGIRSDLGEKKLIVLRNDSIFLLLLLT